MHPLTSHPRLYPPPTPQSALKSCPFPACNTFVYLGLCFFKKKSPRRIGAKRKKRAKKKGFEGYERGPTLGHPKVMETAVKE